MPEPGPAFETIRYERLGSVARIVLDRPPVNAITLRLSRELNQALDHAHRDDAVRAVIVTGSGEKAFSAGVDLVELEPADGQAMRRFLQSFYFEMTEIQSRMGKPTIAALNGPALAGGVTIAVSCDLLIASDRARLGYPEINVGLSPSIHLVLLPRLVGRYKAFELCFTGDPIDAHEAHRLGLVNKVVPHDRVQQEALALAERLAAKPPLAMKHLRDAFYRNLDADFRTGLVDAAEVLCTLKDSADSHEGMQAFREKRAPRWTGR